MTSPERILVTGGTGFVGGHVVRGLLDTGHRVGAVVRPTSSREHLDPRAVACVHDGSTAGMQELVRGFAPTAVVHAATHFVAHHKATDVGALVEANLLFGCQLLEAMAGAAVTRLVNFGTSWQHSGGFEAYRPVSLYAATKQAFEDLAAFYVDAGGLRMVSLKLTDTYGPDDRRAKLVPSLLRIAGSGGTIAMSPGEQVVNFVHVEDVVEAVRVALDRVSDGGQGAEAFLVSGDEDMRLRDVVALVAEATGRPLMVQWGALPYRDREVMSPWKGPRLPGWNPRVRLPDGLRRLARVHV